MQDDACDAREENRSHNEYALVNKYRSNTMCSTGCSEFFLFSSDRMEQTGMNSSHSR